SRASSSATRACRAESRTSRAPSRCSSPTTPMDAKEQVASDVVRRLQAAGHETYFAGGCVRDRLLGRTPGDYDVATAAPPEAVRKLFRRTVGVGAAFGVILVMEGDYQFEVA